MDKTQNIMFSEKGKRINVIDGFKFSFHKYLKNDIERWRCIKRTCKSFYKCENEIIIEKNITHNHEPDEANILTRQTVSNFLKRKEQENPCDRPSKLLHNELQNDIENLIHNDCTLI